MRIISTFQMASIHIISVCTKIDELKYKIDFCSLGTYEKMYHSNGTEAGESNDDVE